MESTLHQFDRILARCREIFLQKQQDYGTSWRIFRPSSLTDQLFIKAKRLRSIEEKGTQQVDDPLEDEYMGLINYSILAIIQLRLPPETPLHLDTETVARYYDEEVSKTRSLLAKKNHDYGEVWRELRLSSITDLILAKLLRIRQIEANAGETTISEGPIENYRDIINYAVFALILLQEQTAT
ncbi:MAG: DUF1599 domain-containing protein [Bacteroidetes bacterium]|nr:MAG: DUF1599 domain-containing protein [Bacteroidota bacterium]